MLLFGSSVRSRGISVHDQVLVLRQASVMFSGGHACNNDRSAE